MICAFMPRVLGKLLHWLDLFPEAYQNTLKNLPIRKNRLTRGNLPHLLSLP
jgi:hypothetical protein